MWTKRRNSAACNELIQQTGTERVQKQAWLGSKCDPLGIVQGTKIKPYK